MTPLEELIATADRLCSNLEIASQNDKKFCTDICFELERYSWEMHRMSNELRQIREYCGI